VKIEISRDDGGTWQTIAPAAPAGSPYTWLATGDTSSLCRVRVSDTSEAAIQDVSDGAFRVFLTTPFVTVLRPNGGDTVHVQAPYEVRWTKNLVDSVQIQYSIDNGGTWENVADPLAGIAYLWEVPNTPSALARLRMYDSTNPTVGDTSDQPFILYTATPGFIPGWSAQTSNVAVPLISVKAVNQSVAWAVGLGGIVLRTTDKGLNWIPLSPLSVTVTTVEAMDHAVALVGAQTSTAALILRTTNGGVSWQQVFTQSGGRINAIQMLDANVGVAIGNPIEGRWTFAKTLNGGVSWSTSNGPLQNGSERGWSNAMHWTSTTRGWFGTNNSRIYYTTNGGNSWRNASTPFVNSLSVYFGTDQIGFCGSSNGVIARSTDGGSTWTTVFAGGADSVWGISGYGIQKTWAENGRDVATSTDAGLTWTVEYVGGSKWNHISMVTEIGLTRGWAVGNDGAVARYGDASVTSVELQEFIPKEFALWQNFPNPFNPTTLIRYDLPANGEVTLRVYNLLGQEVAVLADGHRHAGRYSVSFGDYDLASGVYFARIIFRAEGQSEVMRTTKMVLMR